MGGCELMLSHLVVAEWSLLVWSATRWIVFSDKQSLVAVLIVAVRFGPVRLCIPPGGTGVNGLSVVRDGDLVSIARGWFLRQLE